MIDHGYIIEKCDSLPMVEWDRCILMEGHAAVYGWIKDKGQRPDFVVLQFWFDPEPFVAFLTSSARHSAKINEILLPGEEHLECQTVHDMLPDIDRKVWRKGDPHVVEPAVETGEWLG